MNVILKYWIFIFLIGNICQQYGSLTFLGAPIFYSLLAIGIFCILRDIKSILRADVYKKFSFIYWYAIILFSYQFTFGLLFVHEKTWTYVVSKVVIGFMIVLSIRDNEDFYRHKFYYIIAVLVVILLAIGYFYFNFTVNNRQTLGFGNPNSTGAIASICFGITFLKTSKKTKIQYPIMVMCLLGVLLCGSRTSMGVIVIAFFIKYGFSKKLIISIVGVIFIVAVILPAANIHFTGIDRFISFVETKDFTSGRERERAATMFMIEESPWIGNGIYSQQSEEAQKISLLGSHNAYLDFIKWYGIPLALMLISMMVYYAIKLYRRFRNSEEDADRVHLFVIISVMLAANYEAYIWGVNQMITTMFFVSFAVLQSKYYELENK